MNMIKVSVIVPVYNTENYIRQCVDSICSQTLREIEIIIIDDGSTDKSPLIIKECAENDSRIKIYTQKNAGGGIARNKGINLAQGEYIGFVDADDWIDESYYETLYFQAKNIPGGADLARTLQLRYRKDGIEEHGLNSLILDRIANNKVLEKKDHSFVVLTAIYRREIIIKNKIYFDITKSSHDKLFTVKAVFFSERSIPVSGTYYHHRDNISGQLTTFNTRRLKNASCADRHIIKFINSVDYKNMDDYMHVFRALFWEAHWYFCRSLPVENITSKEKHRFFRNMIYMYNHCKYRQVLVRDYYEPYFIYLEKRNFKQYRAFCEGKELIGQEPMTIRHFLGKARRKMLRLVLGRSLFDRLTSPPDNFAVEAIRAVQNDINWRSDRLVEAIQAVQNNINWRSDRLYNALLRTTPKALLTTVVVSLVEHCNLNCWGCDHCAPLAAETYLDTAEFEHDLCRLAELSGERGIGTIKLMGGEPLLHPDIQAYMIIARRFFSESRIEIVTNGILLAKQPDSFWTSCHSNKITIVATKYPLSIDWEQIRARADTEKVGFNFYRDTETVLKTSRHTPFDVTGTQDTAANFMNCFHANNCRELYHGRLFTCTVAPHAKHFSTFFGQKVSVTEMDSINIHTVKNMAEILEFLAKPIPFCRYCNVLARSWGHPWQKSKREMSEWVIH